MFALLLSVAFAACDATAPDAPQPSEDPVLPGDLLANELPDEVDSGFRLHTHAFPFANFGGDFTGRKLTGDIAAEMFGRDAVCTNAEGPCAPNTLAAQWIASVNETLDAGRSEGLAVAALLFFLGELDPVEYGAPEAGEMLLNDNFGLQALVARLSAAQRVPVVSEQQQAMDAREAMAFLAQALRPGATEAYRLGMAIREENGFRAGHALVPIGFHRVTGRARYALRVYDPNIPQREMFVHIDLETNTWRYDGTTTEEVPMIYEGTPENGNLLYFAPVTPRLEALPAPFGDDSQVLQFSAVGDIQLLADVGEGIRGGFANGQIIQEGGALVLPGFSACPCADGLLNNTTVQTWPTGGLRNANVETTGSGSVYVGGPDYAVRLEVPGGDASSGGGTLSVTQDGRSVSYTSRDRDAGEEAEQTTLEITVPTPNGSTVIRVTVDEDADVQVTTDDQGRVNVTVQGAPEDSEVTVQVTEFAPDGSSRTSTGTSTAGSGDSQMAFEPGVGVYEGVVTPGPCDNGVLDEGETDVDCGGTACVARCERGLRCLADGDCRDGLICGGAGRCVEPGCGDGLRNFDETDVDCGGPTCAPCRAGSRCLEDDDCMGSFVCGEGICRVNARINVHVYGTRFDDDEITVGAEVDGVLRTVAVSARDRTDQTFAAGVLGLGESYANARIISAPADAVCTVRSATSGMFINPIQVRCDWTRVAVRPANNLSDDQWCAQGEGAATVMRLTAGAQIEDIPLTGPLAMRFLDAAWSVELLSRPTALRFFPARDRWGLQSCSLGERRSGGFSSDPEQSPTYGWYDLSCSCLECPETTEEACDSWARGAGVYEPFPLDAVCVRDSDCASNNCECGLLSGNCPSDTGRCGAASTALAGRRLGFRQPQGFIVPDECPGVFIQAWGAAGGASREPDDTIVPGGAGGHLRGVLPTINGELFLIWIAAGGQPTYERNVQAYGRLYDESFAGGGAGAHLDGRRSGGGGGLTSITFPDRELPGIVVPAGAGATPGQTRANPGGHPGSGGNDSPSGQWAQWETIHAGGGAGHRGGLAGTDANPLARGGSFGPLPLGFETFHADEETWNVPPGTESPDYQRCGSNVPAGFASPTGGAGLGCVSMRCIAPSRYVRPSAPNGTACTAHTDCENAWCACDTPGACPDDSGVCDDPPTPNGGACSAHDDCLNQWCACDDPGNCPDDSGVCTDEPVANGGACSAHDDCLNQWCACDTPGNCPGDSGVCTDEPVANGGACSAHDDCLNQWCACDTPGNCPGDSGVCTDEPVANGEACSAHGDCLSEWCACDTPGACPDDGGVCADAPFPDGEACTAHGDCLSEWCGCGPSSGNCAADTGLCGPQPAPGSLGTPCRTDVQCATANCECGLLSGNCPGDSGFCAPAMSVINTPTTDGIAPSGTFTVPAAFCPQVFVTAWGAAGGASSDPFDFGGIAGGAGGFVSGYLDVTSGDVIEAWIGEGGLGGNVSFPFAALGSLAGQPVQGGLGDVDGFDGGGGSGGGLTSLRHNTTPAVVIAVPAGAGAARDLDEAAGAAGVEPFGNHTANDGEDAEEFTRGGGGGAGLPGGRSGTDEDFPPEGGAFGPLPPGFTSATSDGFFLEAAPMTGIVSYVRCDRQDGVGVGSGSEFGEGGAGCVVLRCAAWTEAQRAGAGGAP
ncbi:MAG: hypothetical protein EA398_15310 [Deltaproteobacteria bacterium]|nr:MAG: hypothetical protein EA398_15310 [Deltaproteobacteria bacterium]